MSQIAYEMARICRYDDDDMEERLRWLEKIESSLCRTQRWELDELAMFLVPQDGRECALYVEPPASIVRAIGYALFQKLGQWKIVRRIVAKPSKDSDHIRVKILENVLQMQAETQLLIKVCEHDQALLHWLRSNNFDCWRTCRGECFPGNDAPMPLLCCCQDCSDPVRHMSIIMGSKGARPRLKADLMQCLYSFSGRLPVIFSAE